MDFSRRTPQIILTTLHVLASRGKAVSLDLEYQVHSQSRSEAEFVYLLWEDRGETLGWMTMKNKSFCHRNIFIQTYRDFFNCLKLNLSSKVKAAGLD